ncbi:hypothetical protein SOVF_216730 [Spinacia oleracea]|nr:hypothetical protein SOVF_216730 [Spinacia oleracea]
MADDLAPDKLLDHSVISRLTQFCLSTGFQMKKLQRSRRFLR